MTIEHNLDSVKVNQLLNI